MGAALAGGEALHVVHVVRPGHAVLGTGNDPDALEYLFRAARAFDAGMEMLRSDDVIRTLVAFAEKEKVANIVLGAALPGSKLDIRAALATRLPGVHIEVVP